MISLTAGYAFKSAMELITVLVIFVFVLFVTYYVTKWIAGYQKEHLRQGNLAVTEAIRLPGNKYIEIVRAGKNQYLVIGVGKNELQLLATLTEEELIKLPEISLQGTGPVNLFADTFAEAKKALQNKMQKKK